MMKTLRRMALALVAVMLLDTNIPTEAQAGACCTDFNHLRSPVPSNVLVAPAYTDVLVLLANVSQTQAVPAAANWVIFSADCNFFVAIGASAAVPAASTSNGSAPMQNPAGWNVTGVTQITLVAATNCKITLAFYK